uniref:Uncharacterized protein n=1 Tax=Gasterosteus aculeatus TaxID=69293 RepID=G3Q5I9_GASAC
MRRLCIMRRVHSVLLVEGEEKQKKGPRTPENPTNIQMISFQHFPHESSDLKKQEKHNIRLLRTNTSHIQRRQTKENGFPLTAVNRRPRLR